MLLCLLFLSDWFSCAFLPLGFIIEGLSCCDFFLSFHKEKTITLHAAMRWHILTRAGNVTIRPTYMRLCLAVTRFRSLVKGSVSTGFPFVEQPNGFWRVPERRWLRSHYSSSKARQEPSLGSSPSLQPFIIGLNAAEREGARHFGPVLARP